MEKSIKPKMNVRIVGITKPWVEGSPEMTPEEFIAYCARVSNPSNQLNSGTAAKLLKYCIDHKHWSVFEMVNVVMEIETTRDIARQILRHRSFSYQEFSQRYADPTGMEFVTRPARLQDTKNRQNSVFTADEGLQRAWELKQKQIAHESKLAYAWAVGQGIAKEVARAVLPEGMTMSRLYMNGTVRSWIHYCDVRVSEDGGTQYEHRKDVAEKCLVELRKHFTFLE